ncbi:hypothetical protein ACLMJK_009062 [Lecanora helva]
MVQETTATSEKSEKPTIKKLPRLPKSARIQKRPILRSVIPSPYAGAQQQKVVYVSPRTPFISAVKRVRKLLAQVEKRSMGKVSLLNSKMHDRERLRRLAETATPATDNEPEPVFLKGTNRAIERVLELAMYFQGQEDCKIQLKTGTVGVVDDIVVDDEAPVREEEEQANDKEESSEELPESRIRKATVLKVAITLK